MKALFDFLQTYEMAIYVILAMVGFVSFIQLMAAWREWKAAIFGLEKESAQRRLSSAMAIVILLAFLGLAEFVTVTFIIPVYPQWVVLPTPTLDLLATPTQTLQPGQPTPTAQATTMSVNVTQGCMPGQVEWNYPKNGDEISGAVELRGTINISNLGFYKFEYGQPGSDQWTIIAGDNKPKNDEPLGGVWNTAVLNPGDYLLRLVVLDSQNQPLATCQISVRVLATE